MCIRKSTLVSCGGLLSRSYIQLCGATSLLSQFMHNGASYIHQIELSVTNVFMSFLQNQLAHILQVEMSTPLLDKKLKTLTSQRSNSFTWWKTQKFNKLALKPSLYTLYVTLLRYILHHLAPHPCLKVLECLRHLYHIHIPVKEEQTLNK